MIQLALLFSNSVAYWFLKFTQNFSLYRKGSRAHYYFNFIFALCSCTVYKPLSVQTCRLIYQKKLSKELNKETQRLRPFSSFRPAFRSQLTIINFLTEKVNGPSGLIVKISKLRNKSLEIAFLFWFSPIPFKIITLIWALSFYVLASKSFPLWFLFKPPPSLYMYCFFSWRPLIDFTFNLHSKLKILLLWLQSKLGGEPWGKREMSSLLGWEFLLWMMTQLAWKCWMQCFASASTMVCLISHFASFLVESLVLYVQFYVGIWNLLD